MAEAIRLLADEAQSTVMAVIAMIVRRGGRGPGRREGQFYRYRDHSGNINLPPTSENKNTSETHHDGQLPLRVGRSRGSLVEGSEEQRTRQREGLACDLAGCSRYFFRLVENAALAKP